MEYFWTILDLFDLLFNRERILPRKFDHIRLVSEPQYIKFLDDLQKKYNF